MTRTEKPPPSPSWGWKAIIAVFVTLGVTGVVLAALFRDYSSNPDELTVKERRRNADQVAYSVVFSSVPKSEHDRIISGIAGDVGADSSSTDLVIGSTATNPWNKSLSDYEASLTTAMSESSQLRLGKADTHFVHDRRHHDEELQACNDLPYWGHARHANARRGWTHPTDGSSV